MFNLKKVGYDPKNNISYGNMFLIGDGHLGYRGTLEEFSKEEMVGLNVVGFYDKYLDKWRESINMPNPFFLKMDEYNIFNDDYISHHIELDIKHAIFKRFTEFPKLTISSERFISQELVDTIIFKYEIKAKEDINTSLTFGMDLNIYEINGPHFKDFSITKIDNTILFKGITNENKTLYEEAIYIIPEELKEINYSKGLTTFKLELKKDNKITLYCLSKISINEKQEFYDFNEKLYRKYKKEHSLNFEEKWSNCDIKIKGNPVAQFNLRYSIYHLLILGNETYKTSIPARGVSGETYKGAIFWDTEIFLLPFFTLTNPKIARNLLEYRINTLQGALDKAKEYGYEGAFYAWESQEYGQDACSKYNVTDPITNEPIRTYFNEKQIHISFDIAYAVFKYINATLDESILNEKCFNMLIEIANFAISYSVLKEGKYHILDVIGPDEYHERVDDNAFTNYLIKYVIQELIIYLIKYKYNEKLINKYNEFIDNLYLPKINENKLIEQFSGYFNLEDTTIETVRSRLRHPLDYWGTENGVAYPTRIIKQADVVTLLVLLSEMFDKDVKKANFDFYYPYTEHGSSLSSSMYSILASELGYKDIAYDMFMKSASIDLGTEQKMFAGGIYIGGTHPASNAGAYLSLIFGMVGLSFNGDVINVKPSLPNNIKEIEFKIIYRKRKYIIRVKEKEAWVNRVL